MNQQVVVLLENNSEVLSSRDTLGATNDIEAINIWLQTSAANSVHTFDSYHKEAYRFMLFCESLNKKLVEITAKDTNQYLNLLLNHSTTWLHPKQVPSQKKAQRSTNSLNPSSVAYSKVVLQSMYNFLLHSGHVKHNPFILSRKIQYHQQDIRGKALGVSTWNYISDWLKQQTDAAKENDEFILAIRNRWLMNLLYYTGMRRSSLASATMGFFSNKYIQDNKVWTLSFPTKGNRVHSVIVPQLLLNELVIYRENMGLSSYPNPSEHMPLILSIKTGKYQYDRTGQGISVRGINYAFEQMRQNLIANCENPFTIQELEKLTPHTLRHTCGTHRLISGASIESTQKTLGHRQITTTMIYSHISEEMLLKEQIKLDQLNSNR